MAGHFLDEQLQAALGRLDVAVEFRRHGEAEWETGWLVGRPFTRELGRPFIETRECEPCEGTGHRRVEKPIPAELVG